MTKGLRSWLTADGRNLTTKWQSHQRGAAPRSQKIQTVPAMVRKPRVV